MKKFVSILTILSMLLCSTGGFASNEENAETAFDSTQNRIRLLCDLGILNDSFDVGSDVSRGTFAKAVTGYFSSTGWTTSDNRYFSDVGTSDKELYYAVNLLASYGFIMGDENGCFRPEDTIEYGDAVTILMRILGYEVKAEARGGYSAGYYASAASVGLTKGIAYDMSIGEKTIRLLYNALECPMMVQKEWGADAEIIVDKESTILSTLMKIETIEGVLRSVGKYSISDTYIVNEGYALVGGWKFSVSVDCRASELLGRTVRVYYQNDGSVYNAKSFETVRTDDTLMVNSDMDFELSLEKNTLSYSTDSGKRKTVRLSKIPYIVYNGRSTGHLPLLGENTEVNAVKSNGTEYDVLIIKDYDTFFVSGVSNDGYKIRSMYTDKRLPDLEDIDEIKVFDKSGNPTDTSSIKANDVISVLKDENEEYFEIYISEGTFFGKIDAIEFDSENGQYTLGISAGSYRTTPEFSNYLKSCDRSMLMEMCTDFYTDNFGKIAGFVNKSSLERNLGYVIDAAPGNGFSRPQIKLLSRNGEFVKAELSKDMILDDYGRKIGNTPACDRFVSSFTGGQIIEYFLDNNGAVSKIITASDSSRDGLHLIAELPADATDREKQNGIRYRSSQKCFSSKVILDDSTTVFVIPTDSTEDDYYFTTDISVFQSGRSYRNNELLFYGLSADKFTADAVVYKTSFAGTVRTSDAPELVEKIVWAANSDGNFVERMDTRLNNAVYSYYAQNGKDITVTDKSYNGSAAGAPIEKTNVGKGDIIAIYKNDAGEITGSQIIYSFENKRYYPELNPYETSNEDCRFGLGKVTGCSGNIISFEYDSTNVKEYFTINSPRVIIVEKTGNETVISNGTADDVFFAGENSVFIYSPNNAPSYIYIFKYN